jgi:predicted nucleic acid-binding protein
LPYDAAIRLELISALPIAVDQNAVGLAWTDILDMARAEQLTIYDAAYLELALRRSLPLFTRDKALLASAERRHVRYSVN